MRNASGRISFIGAEIYRAPAFQAPHPLAVDRAMLVKDLIGACGWLDETQYIEAAPANFEELTAFHDADYIAALIQAETKQDLPPDLRERYRIGADANVIHPAVFRRPATSAGGALLAAALLADGGAVHAPGVGNHHGRRDRASGFCFVNDIALGILRGRELGVRRVAYLDLDAHHGDGVEAAFADDPEVLTISVHEEGRWPRTGIFSDSARGALNFLVPAGFNDTELRFLMDQTIVPLITAHRPEVMLLLPGADALEDDPMAKLSLSNNALWDALRAIRGLAPRLAVLGGGGYNPYALARCWAGLWAILNDIPIPDELPEAGRAVLRAVKYFRAAGRNPPVHWLESLRDPPREGAIRDSVKRMAA